MKKKTKIISFLIIVFLLIILFPRLKTMIFGYDILIKDINNLKKSVEKIENKARLNIGDVFFKSKIESNINKDRYLLSKYFLPYKHYYARGLKSSGYLELINDKVIFTDAVGKFFYFSTADLDKEAINFKKIPNNLKDIIKDPHFWKNDATYSIKDIEVFNNELFVSYTKEVKKNCYNTSILKSKLDLNELIFEEFFSDDLCALEIADGLKSFQGREYLAHLSGGRIQNYKKKILFSHGDYQQRSWAQDDDHLFGKILLIDPKTKKVEHFSKGHRNPQGLLYIEDKDIILETEHGPTGGDEINKIFKDGNYGWPISSYGDLPKANFEGGRNDPVPHKTHKDHGFIEPLKYFVPSPGISELIYVPKKFNNKDNNIFVATMGRKKSKPYVYKALYDIEFNDDFSKLIEIDKIIIDERIRDMIYVKSKNLIILVLENSPSVAILKKID